MSPPLIPSTPPGVAPLIDIGIGDRYDASAVAALWGGAGVTTPARWSTPGVENEWGGQEPLWNDIACEVLDISTFTGRDTSTEPFDVGTATVTVRNGDGWADFKPPSGPQDNILTIRPGRQVRIGVKVAAAPPQWLWRGVLDFTEPGYVPNEGDIVTFGCIDAKGDAGRADMPKTLTPVGHGEDGWQRFERILDNVSWPVWRRKHDEDGVQLGGTELGARAASELDRTAESVSGHVYGDTDGKVTFRRKDWMVWAGSTPPDAVIGNIGSGDVCPSGWEVRFSREDLTTRVIVGRADETALVIDNVDARGAYGVETWERTDLLPLDNFELSRIASRVLDTRSPDVMPRIAAVTLHASTGHGEVAALLASCSPFKPSRYRCRHRAADGRLVFDRTMMVTGIRHTLSPTDGWSARLSLDDATPHRQVDNPARWSDPNARWSTDDQWALSL